MMSVCCYNVTPVLKMAISLYPFFFVDELAACYANNIVDETFASLFHRLVFKDDAGVEVNPARFVLCEGGIGGDLHGWHVCSEGRAAAGGKQHHVATA